MPKGVYPRTPEHNQKIAAAKRGKPRSAETIRKMSRAMKGHGHTEETKQKIGAAAKGRAPWNKGHKVGPPSPETREKISAANKGHRGANKGGHLTDEQRRRVSEGKRRSGYRHSPETRRKLAEARMRRTNGPLSEEHKAKLRAYWNSDEGKQRRSRIVRTALAKLSPDQMARRVAHIREYYGPTRIEQAMQAELERRGIRFEAQYPIVPYSADFYLPEWNAVLECDGDYWHSLPEHQARDQERDTCLRAQGYQVVRVWEHDIKADVAMALTRALELVRT